MMDRIEKFANWMSDMDWGWWPLLSLRPARDKDIDSVVLFKMTMFFGTVSGMLVLLIGLWDPSSPTVGSLAGDFLFGWFGFLVVYKVSFAHFWNRRAKRLRSELTW